jgi:hypothetical protein
MAAPKHTTVDPTQKPRSYESPNHVPDRWKLGRPAEIVGRQPVGDRLGAQGPDQGYALTLAHLIAGEIRLQPDERLDDAIRGCLGIALRRASRLGRAPVIHDVRFAFTIWGWFLDQPPADLVLRRKQLFAGLGNVQHHYSGARDLVDMVPETTFLMTPTQLQAAMPGSWRALTGA